MLHRRWIFPLLALTVLLVLAACGGQPTPEPTPARQAKPTFTPTPQGQLPNAVLFETPVNPTAAATEVAALPTAFVLLLQQTEEAVRDPGGE